MPQDKLRSIRATSQSNVWTLLTLGSSVVLFAQSVPLAVLEKGIVYVRDDLPLRNHQKRRIAITWPLNEWTHVDFYTFTVKLRDSLAVGLNVAIEDLFNTNS